MILAYSSRFPWEKFSRKTSTPARIRSRIVSISQLAGPSVHRALEGARERVELAPAADERRSLAARNRRHIGHLEEVPGCDRLALSLQREGAGRLCPNSLAYELKRALAVYGQKSVTTFRVASNPEFLREGTAVADFLHPDRIVVGVEDEATGDELREIFRPILEQHFQCPVHAGSCPAADPPPFLVTTINSAELIKHASNSFLALKISYTNAIADLCERSGANVDEVTRAVGLDPRIGPHFLRAGIGFGGFCLPKDIQAFIRLAERAGADFALLKEAEKINRQRIDLFLEKMRRALWVLRDKQIGVLGLAFKPHTDDIRFAPALELIRRLLQESARVRAYDPQAMEKARHELPDLIYAADSYAVAQDADAVVIATEWPEFRELNWERIRDSMARPLVFDGRNLLDPPQMKALGFEYHSVGRPD